MTDKASRHSLSSFFLHSRAYRILELLEPLGILGNIDILWDAHKTPDMWNNTK